MIFKIELYEKRKTYFFNQSFIMITESYKSVQIFNIVFPIFAIAILGYVLGYRNFFDGEEISGIARFVFMVAIPLMLRQKRIAAGLSQKEMAKQLGISFQQLQKLESPGKSNPTVKTLARISEVLDTELLIDLVASREAALCRSWALQVVEPWLPLVVVAAPLVKEILEELIWK